MTHKILLVGCGSQGRVVLDLFHRAGRLGEVGAFLDAYEDEVPPGRQVDGLPVAGGLGFLEGAIEAGFDRFLVTIGENHVREQVTDQGLAAGLALDRIVAPSAVLGRDVEVGEGAMVSAGAIVVTGSRIGRGVILNTGCSVDHDNRVGDYAHICPGAHLAGNVEVGHRTTIGIGASVIQGIRIGHDAMIGAGAAVVEDIPDNVTAIGVPARIYDPEA